MDLSVVIPTRDRASSLDVLLRCLERQDFIGSWEIVVADNNSSDGTATVAERHGRVVRVLERAPGAARARNTGAAAARGDFLLFLDDDMRPEPAFLQSMASALERFDRCWIMPKVQLPIDRRNTPLARFRTMHAPPPSHGEPTEVEWFASGAAGIRCEVFEELGGYDESFPGAGMEDRDVAIRSRALGISIVVVPSIAIDHDDWAGDSFDAYLHRQRTYARTAVRFAEVHGIDHPDAAMVRTVLSGSGPRKWVKWLLGTDPGLRLLTKVAQPLEQHSGSRLLNVVYTAGTAAAIGRGVREEDEERRRHDSADAAER